MPFDYDRDTFCRRLRCLMIRTWDRLHPSPPIRRAAGWTAIVTALLLLVIYGQSLRPGLGLVLDRFVGPAVFLTAAVIIGLTAILAIVLLRDIPRFLGWPAVALTGGFTIVLMTSGDVLKAAIVGLGFTFGEALFAGAIAAVVLGRLRGAGLSTKVLVFAIVTGGLWANWFVISWMVSSGSNDHLVPYTAPAVLPGPLTAPNPGEPGHHDVRFLTYGSGTDRHRPEFGPEADFVTPAVDATPFTEARSPWRTRARRSYWGFGLDALPLNGRVWYPGGGGPFPLVLIVHGNHLMEEHSDPGYEYLGEHLASRGYIAVSVDQNFLNGTWSGNLKSENDARAWMLLKHLELWRAWAADETHPFYAKVDLGNIGLIGHSRGGEAVAIAGAFNRLAHYPENAMVTFDFNFDINAIIAIAPVDGQYEPAGRPTPLENVNYLVIHGAHDADVSAFAGARQYNRLRFTDAAGWFKASVYVYRANHGQFNTVWGNTDLSFPLSLQLNRKPLLSGGEQRQIARVYFGGFLDATLKGKSVYRPMFQDHRKILHWLPRDYYITRYADRAFQVLADFEEDIDLTTGTMEGVRLAAEHLAVWRELAQPHRKTGTKRNTVVNLGWRRTDEDVTPSYALRLPENTPVEDAAALVFSAAEAHEDVPGGAKNGKDGGVHSDEDAPFIDFTIAITLADGKSVSFPLSQFRRMPPRLTSRMTKTYDHGKRYGAAWEPALQRFDIPLDELGIDESRSIREIRFVFDQTPSGAILLDDIGFQLSTGR